jgi:hypothetical protein
MQEYQAVYNSLAIPVEVIECALGRTQIPIIGWESPANWYGFPPALIPIASNGSGPNYFGIWKHWFSDRKPSYVIMYVGSGRMVVEVARNADQFFSYIAMTALGIDDGIESQLEQFASKVGIPNLSEHNSVSLKSGDRPQGFASLLQFRSDVPLNSIRDAIDYTGDFPTSGFSDPRQRWANACSFEMSSEFWKKSLSQVELPRWLTSESKQNVFYDFFSIGDLRSAWLTLNSTGWSIAAAKTALFELVRVANDPNLEALADAWSKVANPSAGGY